MKNNFSAVFSKIMLGGLVALLCAVSAPSAFAKTKGEIDASVDAALTRFNREIPGAKGLIAKSKGVLILPSVIKAGIGIGGEYGEGALRINGKTKEYYNTIGGSLGFQLGAQVKSIYLLFMNSTVLKEFELSEGWKAGVDGSVALVTIGADGTVDTTQTNQPIVAFVLGQKGLMYNLTLEGSKFNKIIPD